MNPAMLLKLAPYLAMIPGIAKKVYASKHFLPAAGIGAFAGSEVLGQLGAAGDRGTAREQIQLQKAIALMQAEGTKKATKESRKSTKEYLKEVTKIRQQEMQAARESEMLQNFLSSQDRQAAVIMQAMQGLSQTSAPYGGMQPQGRQPRGMVSLMRSRV